MQRVGSDIIKGINVCNPRLYSIFRPSILQSYDPKRVIKSALSKSECLCLIVFSEYEKYEQQKYNLDIANADMLVTVELWNCRIIRKNIWQNYLH